ANAQPLALHGIVAGVFPFRVEQIDALVTAGLDLGAKDTTGWTALHCAARIGDSNVVATILEKQPSKELIEATTQGGWRALHHAVACGHLGVVEELLAADAEVDPHIEKEGLTPLHLSAMLGHMEITDLLLQCGANPHATTTGLRRTALHL
uniref:Uncharacterized protein n=1 Tax=Globisporangium ultimum (strain ATCC 200006 / CBS 805.95 / DAOM BR144) TaxID=431595 RepID=K3WQS9_GLOUD